MFHNLWINKHALTLSKYYKHANLHDSTCNSQYPFDNFTISNENLQS